MSSNVGEPFQRISIDLAKQKIDTELILFNVYTLHTINVQLHSGANDQ